MFSPFGLEAKLDSFGGRARLLYSRFPAVDRFTLLLVSAYVLVIVISGLASPAGYYDEAITLVQGRMVAEGHIPHVDFWSFYPPLTYYLNAAAFAVFGKTILAQRLLEAGFYALFLIFSNRFLRARFANVPFIVGGTTFLVAVAIGPKFLLPPFIGFSISLFALFTFFSALAARADRLRQRIAVAGILAGLALTSRFNFGAYAATTIILGLLLVRFFRAGNSPSEQVKVLRSWSTMAAFVLSLLVSWVGVYLLLSGPHLVAAVTQSIIFPQQQVMGLRFIPLKFTTGLALSIMFPCFWFWLRLSVGREQIPRKALVPLLLAFVILVMAWLQGANPAVARDVAVAEIAFVLLLHIFVYRLESSEISLVLLFACLLHYYLSRADEWHWPLLLPIAGLLVPYLLVSPSGGQQRLNAEHVRHGTTVALFALLIALLWCLPGFRPSQIRNGIDLILRGRLLRQVSDSERMLGAPSPPQPWLPIYFDLDELNALRFLRLRTSINDPIFIGVDNHSQPFAVDVRAYWLLDRRIGSNYYIFDPDLTRKDVVQKAMIEDLEENDVRWVVLEHEPPMDDSFRQRRYPGARLLDRFLAANFAEVARFGRYGVLKKSRL